MQVVISYSDVFDDDPENIDELLRDIPSFISLQIVVHFLTQIHMNEKNDKGQFEFLKMWLSRQSKELKSKFFRLYTSYKERNANFNFINNISCLHLIQKILDNFNDLESHELTPEQELRLLKAYLLSSSEWTEKSHSLLDDKKEYDTPEKIVDLILPVQLPIDEIKQFKDFRLQFYKAVEFFEFCETDPLFKEMLDEFLRIKKVKSWREYISTIINAYLKLIDKASKKSILEINDANVQEFFDELCLDIKNYSPVEDYLNIRDKPILKIKEKQYLFLNINFLIDKLFQGIQFDLFKAIKGKSFLDNVMFNDFPVFKSKLSEDFTEKYLFKRLIEKTFCADCVHIPEEKFKKEEISPDYYIRRRTKVFIFEFKDILFSSKSKYSYDIDKIKSELILKLVENEKGEPKGISQIVNCIELLLKNGMKESDDFDFNTAKFYPIIVVTDQIVQEFGINYILKSKFNEMKEKLDLPNKHNIKDPVVVYFDDLIKFQKLFLSNKIKINSIFDEFNGFTNSKNPWQVLSSFSDFLHDKASKFKTDPTEFISEKIEKL